MSAIETIIKTYLRFSDERALLALKAHRLKLLAATDERDPFSRSLRSQCAEEISAIEAGLATFQRAAPAVVEIDNRIEIASGGREPSGGDVGAWTEAASGSAPSEARPPVDRVAEEIGPVSLDPVPEADQADVLEAAMEPVASSSDLLTSLQNPFYLPARGREPPRGRVADRLLQAGLVRTPALASPAWATGDHAESRLEMEEGPLRFARMAASGSLIASWPLRLQDEPYVIEPDATIRWRGGGSANPDGTLTGGCLCAGVPCLVIIRFGQH